MRTTRRRTLAACALGAGATLGLARAQDPGSGETGEPCPDQKASPVAEVVVDLGAEEDCRLEIKLFGFGSWLATIPCPALRVIVPEHEACLGETLVESTCVPDGQVAADVQVCECSPVASALFEGDACTCTSFSQGHVETATTAGC